jgi:hypothetical protein
MPSTLHCLTGGRNVEQASIALVLLDHKMLTVLKIVPQVVML